jgi:hypothetical protein
MAKSPSKKWPNRQAKHGQIAKQNMAKSPNKIRKYLFMWKLKNIFA